MNNGYFLHGGSIFFTFLFSLFTFYCNYATKKGNKKRNHLWMIAACDNVKVKVIGRTSPSIIYTIMAPTTERVFQIFKELNQIPRPCTTKNAWPAIFAGSQKDCTYPTNAMPRTASSSANPPHQATRRLNPSCS